MGIIRIALGHRFPFLFQDHAKMRINIIIILSIIFMAGGRYEQWIKIQHFHTQFFQIIQLLYYTCQISTIKISHIKIPRVFIPV